MATSRSDTGRASLVKMGASMVVKDLKTVGVFFRWAETCGFKPAGVICIPPSTLSQREL